MIVYQRLLVHVNSLTLDSENPECWVESKHSSAPNELFNPTLRTSKSHTHTLSERKKGRSKNSPHETFMSVNVKPEPVASAGGVITQTHLKVTKQNECKNLTAVRSCKLKPTPNPCNAVRFGTNAKTRYTIIK